MTVRGARAACLLLLGAGLALAPGCTLFDDVAGSSFRLDQPQGAVTLEGAIHVDRITGSTSGCDQGGTIFWGSVRNTGDVNVADVSIVVKGYNAQGGLVTAVSTSVFNGEVIDTEGGLTEFGTDLEIDQGGTFSACTGVPFGTVTRTEYETRFVVIDESGT